jgi:hypothetical protein
VSTAAPPVYGHRRQYQHGGAASLWSHKVAAQEKNIQHSILTTKAPGNSVNYCTHILTAKAPGKSPKEPAC